MTNLKGSGIPDHTLLSKQLSDEKITNKSLRAELKNALVKISLLEKKISFLTAHSDAQSKILQKMATHEDC